MTPPPPVAPPPPPPKPQVRRGDLVELGPGVVAPELVRRPAPRFPEQARRLARKDAKVLIKVLIDEYGRVSKAELVGEKQGYGFDTEALNAARRSVYKPATKDGVPVKIWQTLAVEFRAD
jgi:protein TonB